MPSRTAARRPESAQCSRLPILSAANRCRLVWFGRKSSYESYASDGRDGTLRPWNLRSETCDRHPSGQRPKHMAINVPRSPISPRGTVINLTYSTLARTLPSRNKGFASEWPELSVRAVGRGRPRILDRGLPGTVFGVAPPCGLRKRAVQGGEAYTTKPDYCTKDASVLHTGKSLVQSSAKEGEKSRRRLAAEPAGHDKRMRDRRPRFEVDETVCSRSHSSLVGGGGGHGRPRLNLPGLQYWLRQATNYH